MDNHHADVAQPTESRSADTGTQHSGAADAAREAYSSNGRDAAAASTQQSDNNKSAGGATDATSKLPTASVDEHGINFGKAGDSSTSAPPAAAEAPKKSEGQSSWIDNAKAEIQKQVNGMTSNMTGRF